MPAAWGTALASTALAATAVASAALAADVRVQRDARRWWQHH